MFSVQFITNFTIKGPVNKYRGGGAEYSQSRGLKMYDPPPFTGFKPDEPPPGFGWK
jgi:hypothetical protein